MAQVAGRGGGFGYKQAVRNLADGSLYRVRVDFRWSDARRQAASQRRARSSRDLPPARRAAQPPRRIRGRKHTPAQASDRYAIRVTNFGDAPAQGCPSRLSVDGEVAASGTFGALAAKSSVTLTLRGPECKHFVKAQVDPDSADRGVRTRADNVALRSLCRLGS